MDFNIIIEIVTTDPKNETTIKDQKVLIVQTTIKEAEDGFVKWLKVSKVIPKNKFVVVKLVLYNFFFNNFEQDSIFPRTPVSYNAFSTQKNGYVWVGDNKLPLLLKRDKIADELPAMAWCPIQEK